MFCFSIFTVILNFQQLLNWLTLRTKWHELNICVYSRTHSAYCKYFYFLGSVLFCRERLSVVLLETEENPRIFQTQKEYWNLCNFVYEIENIFLDNYMHQNLYRRSAICWKLIVTSETLDLLKSAKQDEWNVLDYINLNSEDMKITSSIW